MGRILGHKLTKQVQRIFWVYLTNNFVINGLDDFRTIDLAIECDLMPITLNNYHRVGDFREEGRVQEYRDKLAHNEIGFFAEHNGKMIGSIWATANKTDTPSVVRSYMQLMPNEGLVHDIVTSEKCRGMGIGPLMVSRFVPILLREHGLSRVIIDVNIRNRASLRMMKKAGLGIDHKMLNVSLFGKLAFRRILRKYG